MSKGILVVVSGFSGSGKGTVMKRLMEKYDNYALSVSVTTRNPRPGEKDGEAYFFRTKEEFEQGDFCILDLTELQEYDGKYLSAVSPDGQGISEDTVQVGDELPVYTLNENGSRNENPIPVTAILRGMKEEDVRNPQIGGSGISMIVGKNFWKKFGKSRIMEYDQIVKILVSDDADAYDTEGHILSILKQGTAVNVQNNHEEYKKIRQELYSFIGMYSIFAVFYMILISIVLYQMFLAEKQEEKREGESPFS